MAFWILIIAAGVLLTHLIDGHLAQESEGSVGIIRSGAWGDLEEWDIRIEQPQEYAGFEKTTADGPFWSFGATTRQAVHDLLIGSGCTEEQSSSLLAKRMEGMGAIFILKPDFETVLNLPPEVRSKLYLQLARNPANRFQETPYFIPNGDVDKFFDTHHFSDEKAKGIMKRLLYQRNGFTYFSDPESVIKGLDSDQERGDFLRSLTSQNAILARLLIRSDSDIDKPLNYWALSMPGVLLKDLKPLFESQKRLPHGGSLSLLYALPPIARDRLYTSPLPPSDGDPRIPDCHWTALNFFSLTPDPRMSDNGFASRFITDHYYEIAKPSTAGDLVLLLNSSGGVIHSAVYLADDVVFTKNGINYAQPWILMHERDLVGTFSAISPVKVAYFRRRGM
ncbi:MAG: hypothetical protein K8R57_01745 [Verrucomicrobia bacterium]|nr:hypothetical protein [Verrucomicrobiota bacterium]